MNHGSMQVSEIRSKISQIELDVLQIRKIISALVSHIFTLLYAYFLQSDPFSVYMYMIFFFN